MVYVWALEQPKTSSLYRHPLQYLYPDNQQDVLVPWISKDKTTGQTATQMRYYHLFKLGELDKLIEATGSLEINYKGYNADNWYVCATKI